MVHWLFLMGLIVLKSIGGIGNFKNFMTSYTTENTIFHLIISYVLVFIKFFVSKFTLDLLLFSGDIFLVITFESKISRLAFYIWIRKSICHSKVGTDGTNSYFLHWKSLCHLWWKFSLQTGSNHLKIYFYTFLFNFYCFVFIQQKIFSPSLVIPWWILRNLIYVKKIVRIFIKIYKT